MKKIDKIFGDKKTNSVIYILLAVGIFMLTLGGKSMEHSTNTAVSSPDSGNFDEEKRLEDILSEIEGVGEVSVMMCLTQNSRYEEQSVFSNSEETDREKVAGVLVVADGASDAAVREKIVRATKAVLGVDSHKIEVLERTVRVK